MHRPSEPEPFRPTVTRYVGPDGRRCDSRTPGARKIRTKSRVYVADLYDRGRRERVSLKTTDKGQAWVNLKAKLRERKEEDAGLRPRATEEAKPLPDHLAEWLAGLESGGVDPARVGLMRSRLTLLLELAGWKWLEDIGPDSCRAGLVKLGQATTQTGACRLVGRSAQTRNHYLQHARQFVRWLWEVKGRLRSNPLKGVKPVSVESDRRHDRRVAEDWEVARLLAYLEGDGGAVVRAGTTGRGVYVQMWHERPAVLRGMSGPQRALGYRLCMATGLRGKELRRLTPDSFDLERETLTVLGKNRKVETLNLPPWLARRLKEWLARGGELWQGFPARAPGRVLQHDLHRAGVAYRVEGPRGPLYLDFHSLRHWFITTSAHLPGMELRTLMEVARLSSAHLAMRVYSHAKEQRKRDVAAQIPEMG